MDVDKARPASVHCCLRSKSGAEQEKTMRYLTKSMAAAHWGVSGKTVQRWRQKGLLKYRRDGGRMMVDVDVARPGACADYERPASSEVNAAMVAMSLAWVSGRNIADLMRAHDALGRALVKQAATESAAIQ